MGGGLVTGFGRQRKTPLPGHAEFEEPCCSPLEDYGVLSLAWCDPRTSAHQPTFGVVGIPAVAPLGEIHLLGCQLLWAGHPADAWLPLPPLQPPQRVLQKLSELLPVAPSVVVVFSSLFPESLH